MPARRQSADDACPGALRLHAAADGPLARVRLPGGRLTGAQLATLAELAGEFGDGALELTSRANIQLRALRATPELLATRLAQAGLLPSLAHETVRNIAAPPLAGPTTRTLVDALDQGLCADPALARLPGRFLFAIGPTSLSADVAALPAGDHWAILLAGADVGLRVPADRVVDTLLAAAHAFLAERDGRDPRPWRLRELPDGPELIRRRLAPADLPTTDISGLGEVTPLLGILGDGDAMAVGALVPLGRLDGVPQRVLAKAERMAVTPSGGVVVPDLTAAAADRWLSELRAAGLATEADSKWAGVTTCAGRPGCGKALADVRADAAATARYVPGLRVHWVGCARGCGTPAGEHVRVEATADGYRVDGEPVGSTDLGEVVAARRA